MSKQVIPYKVTVGDARDSIPFNIRLKEVMAKKLENKFKQEIDPKKVQFQNFFLKSQTSSSKILMGPEPKTRLVALFRRLNLKNDNDKDQNSFFYFGLFLVDLETPQLDFNRILQLTQQKSDKVRDVITHPKADMFTVLYENKIENYILKKPSKQALSIKYAASLIQSDTYNFTSPLSTSDVQYHPDGKHLIGFITENDTAAVFKLQMSTKTMKKSDNMLQKCLADKSVSYLRKWAISINKNVASKAIVVGGLQKFCYLDLNTLKFELFSIQTDIKYNNYAVMVPPAHNEEGNNFNSKNTTLTSTSFINSTNKGVFYVFEETKNQAFVFQSTPDLQYIKTLNFSSNFPFNSIDRQKCIDIPHINGVVCMRQNLPYVTLSKHDIPANKYYELGLIFGNKPVIVNNDSFGNQMVEDILYSQTTSQICLFYDTILRCFKLSTNCTSDSGEKPINQCENQCKSANSNTYWDPMSMSCVSCNQSCQCNNKNDTFDPYYRGCVLNCSNYALAYADTQYQNKQSCVCKNPLSWDKLLKKCRFDCSTIKYSDPKADLASLELTQCKCIRGFRFLRKLGAIDTPGFCQLICPNGYDAEVVDNIPICQCGNQQTWNLQKFACMTKNGILVPNKYTYPDEQVKSGLPGWTIALIVISSLLFLAFLGLCIWKKIKNRNFNDKIRQSRETVPQSSERNQRNLGKSSQQQLGQIKMCPICKMDDVNCMGPCGHYYHFYCIKQKLSQQSNECPECRKQFQNGIADIKLVEKQSQCLTISQN